jgi:hypothetical protein
MQAGGIREVRSGVFLTAALAGLAAAIVGGVVWGLIVRWSDYEIGFAAWGIGFIVGTAVVLGAQNERGMPLQLIAVVLALFGIVLGKYLAFVWIGQDELGKAGISLPVFSTDTMRLFWDLKSDIWGGWDLLWVGLAVVSAFRIPQPEPEPEPAEAPNGSRPAAETTAGAPEGGTSAPDVDTASSWSPVDRSHRDEDE